MEKDKKTKETSWALISFGGEERGRIRFKGRTRGDTPYAVASVHLMLVADTRGSRSGLHRATGSSRARLRSIVVDSILVVVKLGWMCE